MGCYDSTRMVHSLDMRGIRDTLDTPEQVPVLEGSWENHTHTDIHTYTDTTVLLQLKTTETTSPKNMSPKMEFGTCNSKTFSSTPS